MCVLAGLPSRIIFASTSPSPSLLSFLPRRDALVVVALIAAENTILLNIF